MKITKVYVEKKERENSKMRGKAIVTIDDCFVIKGIRILEGNEGLFIAFPSKDYTVIDEDGNEIVEHRDMAHPINKETRTMFEEAIYAEYNNIK